MEPHQIIVTTPLELKAIVADAVAAALKYQQPSQAKSIEPDLDGWVGIDEAAEILRLAKPTVYANRRKIPHSKKHGQLYFKPSELRAYIASGKKKTLKELEKEAESAVERMNSHRLTGQKSGR